MQLFERPLTEQELTAIRAFADGIECGAKLRPQTKGSYFKKMPIGETEQFCSCALGAALECALVKKGISLDTMSEHEIRKLNLQSNDNEFSALYDIPTASEWRNPSFPDPETAHEWPRRITFLDVVWRLNDYADMTREEIADLLRSVT